MRRPCLLPGFVPAAVAALLLLAAARPVVAKELVEARFDAPIGRDTPAGTVLVVGMLVTAEVGDETTPVEGNPVYLRLTGPGGVSTRAAGAGDRTPGHYTMTIAIPAGGVTTVEVGIHGTSDLPITIASQTLVAGGISPATAQAAPTPAALMTAPTASTAGAAALVEPVAAEPVDDAAGATAPRSAAEPAGSQAAAPGVLAAALALGAGLVAAIAVRRARRARGADPTAPGA